MSYVFLSEVAVAAILPLPSSFRVTVISIDLSEVVCAVCFVCYSLKKFVFAVIQFEAEITLLKCLIPNSLLTTEGDVTLRIIVSEIIGILLRIGGYVDCPLPVIGQAHSNLIRFRIISYCTIFSFLLYHFIEAGVKI